MRSGLLLIASLVAGGAAIAHAVVTWSPPAGLVFTAVVVGLALAAEVVAIRLGLLVHHTRPRAVGVPIAALAGWIAIVYASTRVAILILGGALVTPLLAGATAAMIDGVLDPVGVRWGWWSYPPAPISRPRYAGVPWWNVVAWFVLATISSAIVLGLAP